MSLRFVLLSFTGLGWAFYELSGGAAFEPPVRTVQTAEIAAKPSAKIPPVVAIADTFPAPVVAEPQKVAHVTAERSAVTHDVTQAVALTQVSQPLLVLGNTTPNPAGDETQQLSTLQLTSLEGGLGALTETQPANQATETAAQDIRRIRGSRVNMRQGPGTSYSVIARLVADENVVVLEDNGAGWLRLKSQTNGRVGWIAASLVSRKAP
ncbi:SH3 domain-containing protein [Epibacterium ulvae]|uniref:SH3 domain-containing protein n=1 Tax=Epibacterium ulvae TaxID=1156985 RepID=UPI0024939B66|nr:SH3 domain-containing protein [Epibacterium ulvae]